MSKYIHWHNIYINVMDQNHIKLLTMKIANLIKKSKIPLMYGSDIEKKIGSEHKETIKWGLNFLKIKSHLKTQFFYYNRHVIFQLNECGIIKCRKIHFDEKNEEKFDSLDNILIWFDDIHNNNELFKKISPSLSRSFVIRKSYQTTIEEKEGMIKDKENEVNRLKIDVEKVFEKVKKSNRLENDADMIRICHEIKKIEEETEKWRDALHELLNKLSSIYGLSKEETIIKLRIPVHTRRLARLD